jgi:hypothetical protein
MSSMQVPFAAEVIARMLDTNNPQVLDAAGHLKLNTPEAVAVMQKYYVDEGMWRVPACYALYRATAEEKYRSRLTDIVLESHGLVDSGSTFNGDVALTALRCLINCGPQKAVPVLRRIVTRADPRYSSNSYTCALNALYWAGDYAFVDETILSYIRGQLDRDRVDVQLIWKIAVARNTLEIREAAYGADPYFFDHTFHMDRNLPSAFWIYDNLYGMPADVRQLR